MACSYCRVADVSWFCNVIEFLLVEVTGAQAELTVTAAPSSLLEELHMALCHHTDYGDTSLSVVWFEILTAVDCN